MKVGKFSISRCAIDDGLGKYIYRDTVPVRVEMDYVTDHLQITAIADWFDDISRGQEVPWYDYELDFESITDRDITGVVTGGHSVFRGIKWTKRNV